MNCFGLALFQRAHHETNLARLAEEKASDRFAVGLP